MRSQIAVQLAWQKAVEDEFANEVQVKPDDVESEFARVKSGARNAHFMVAEIAGDRMFFEAITHSQEVIDCGVLYRTNDAATKKPDDTTAKWLADCETSRAKPRTTHQ